MLDSSLTEDCAQIDGTWDDQVSRPRIIWWDKQGGIEYIWAARVSLDDNDDPTGVEGEQVVKDSSENPTEQFGLPAMEANDFDETKFTISGAKWAFASLKRSVQQPKIQGYQLSSAETWTPLEITDRNDSLSPDSTFRAFATPRFSFVNGSDIYTNTEYVCAAVAKPKMFTRIATNSGKLIDVFLIYSFGPENGDEYELDIVEVDP